MTKKKIGGCGLFGKVEENYFYKDDIRRVKFDRPDKLNVSVRLVIARYKDFQDIDTDSIKENLYLYDFNMFILNEKSRYFYHNVIVCDKVL